MQLHGKLPPLSLGRLKQKAKQASGNPYGSEAGWLGRLSPSSLSAKATQTASAVSICLQTPSEADLETSGLPSLLLEGKNTLFHTEVFHFRDYRQAALLMQTEYRKSLFLN